MLMSNLNQVRKVGKKHQKAHRKKPVESNRIVSKLLLRLANYNYDKVRYDPVAGKQWVLEKPERLRDIEKLLIDDKNSIGKQILDEYFYTNGWVCTEHIKGNVEPYGKTGFHKWVNNVLVKKYKLVEKKRCTYLVRKPTDNRQREYPITLYRLRRDPTTYAKLFSWFENQPAPHRYQFTFTDYSEEMLKEDRELCTQLGEDCDLNAVQELVDGRKEYLSLTHKIDTKRDSKTKFKYQRLGKDWGEEVTQVFMGLDRNSAVESVKQRGGSLSEVDNIFVMEKYGWPARIETFLLALGDLAKTLGETPQGDELRKEIARGNCTPYNQMSEEDKNMLEFMLSLSKKSNPLRNRDWKEQASSVS